MTDVTVPTDIAGADAADRISNDELYRALRARITHLDLPPGARLTEQGIAAEYGLSRTPVRRVLDRLANDGLVTIHHGSGASVSAIDYRALREVWALRLRIADVVGDFVRLPAPEAIITRLEHLLAALDEVTTSDQLPALYDDYHDTMLDLLTNGPLRRIHDQLYAQTARAFVQMLPSLDLDTEIEAFRDELVLSIDACRQRSGAVLAELRGRHMRAVIDRINRALMIAPPPSPS